MSADVASIARAMAEPLYRLHDVSRVYRTGAGEVRALDGVDLDIASGDFVAIEGPSGSGKTTMLQILGALDRPTSGSVRFDGRELRDLGDADLTGVRRHDVGFVFQHFNLIPTLTASENVEAALVSSESNRKQRRERAQSLLDQVGLSARMDHLPSRLSGGEQQRVAIARSLANDPRVVLADEPTGNLDTATAAGVMSLLGSLSERGVTVVVVTHAQDVATLARRRLKMRDGRFVDGMTKPPVCPACASSDVGERREHAACASCGKRFVRRAKHDTPWSACPACGGDRTTVRGTVVCGSCGTARDATERTPTA